MEIQSAENEILKDEILIKRKLKRRLRTRHKRVKKKTLFDVKAVESINGDKAPIQRLEGNKTKTKLSAQTPMKTPQLSEDFEMEILPNIANPQTFQENRQHLNSINSNKVRFKIASSFLFPDLVIFMREMETITNSTPAVSEEH